MNVDHVNVDFKELSERSDFCPDTSSFDGFFDFFPSRSAKKLSGNILL